MSTSTLHLPLDDSGRAERATTTALWINSRTGSKHNGIAHVAVEDKVAVDDVEPHDGGEQIKNARSKKNARWKLEPELWIFFF